MVWGNQRKETGRRDVFNGVQERRKFICDETNELVGRYRQGGEVHESKKSERGSLSKKGLKTRASGRGKK